MTTKIRLPEINRYHDRTAPTPLVPVRLDDTGATIWCKLEFLNPSGSTKDRIASYILGKALRRGEIGPGGTVVEASSGSTSIAMALALRTARPLFCRGDARGRQPGAADDHRVVRW